MSRLIALLAVFLAGSPAAFLAMMLGGIRGWDALFLTASSLLVALAAGAVGAFCGARDSRSPILDATMMWIAILFLTFVTVPCLGTVVAAGLHAAYLAVLVPVVAAGGALSLAAALYVYFTRQAARVLQHRAAEPAGDRTVLAPKASKAVRGTAERWQLVDPSVRTLPGRVGPVLLGASAILALLLASGGNMAREASARGGNLAILGVVALGCGYAAHRTATLLSADAFPLLAMSPVGWRKIYRRLRASVAARLGVPLACGILLELPRLIATFDPRELQHLLRAVALVAAATTFGLLLGVDTPSPRRALRWGLGLGLFALLSLVTLRGVQAKPLPGADALVILLAALLADQWARRRFREGWLDPGAMRERALALGAV